MRKILLLIFAVFLVFITYDFYSNDKTTTKEETIYYIRTLLIHENEHLYDLGSHVQFYSIENTEGEMSLYWKDEEIELP